MRVTLLAPKLGCSRRSMKSKAWKIVPLGRSSFAILASCTLTRAGIVRQNRISNARLILTGDYFESDHPKLLDVMEAYAAFLRTAKRKSEAKKLETYVREARERYRVENPWMGNAVDARSLVGTRAH